MSARVRCRLARGGRGSRCRDLVSKRANARTANRGRAVSTLTGASIPRLPRGVRLHFDRVRDAHVLLAPERAFNVDDVAVMVLKLVDGSRTIASLAEELATRFNADPAVIERDVTRMLGDLVAKRVVEA